MSQINTFKSLTYKLIMELDYKLKKVSINLSKILRHQAINRKLNIDNGGWVKIDDILKCNEFKDISMDDINFIVENNNKKRFSIKYENKNSYIRANQGHSINTIKEDELLEEITDINYINNIVHSTFRKNFKLIKENGLCKMKRNHIHFAKTKNVSSGIRKNADVYIYIDVINAMKDGIKFYESSNGVILSPGIGKNGIIPEKYFPRVEFENLKN